MKCPVCKKVTLINEDLLENLKAKTCPSCNGRWVQSFQYWKWLDQHGDTLPEKPSQSQQLPLDDSPAGKLCPECGHFLTRRKVGHDLNFHLDRCNCCGGIWFDKNEWETLQSRNLHDEVHFIFSAAWQNQIRQTESAQEYENRIESILGPQDHTRLKEISNWINTHKEKNTILAYIKQNK